MDNRTVVDLYDNSTGVPDGRIWLAGDQALTAADFVLKTSKPFASTLRFASAMSGLGASSAHISAPRDDWAARSPMLCKPV